MTDNDTEKHELIGYYPFSGYWASAVCYGRPLAHNEEYLLDMADLRHLIAPERLATVAFQDFFYKNMSTHQKLRERYQQCDIRFPGILVKGMPNPTGKPYTMIDGRHRLYKMTNLGMKQAPFYVLTEAEIIPFVTIRQRRFSRNILGG